MIKKIKRIYYRRKAVSPVVAALLLIALTVAAVAIVYFVIVPIFQRHRIEISIDKIKDTNKDSLFDEISLYVVNTGTKSVEIVNITVWTATTSTLATPDFWVPHLDWVFDIEAQAISDPSEVYYAKISGDNQIGLTIWENTFYRLEIQYTGSKNPYFSDWESLNDLVDLFDILTNFSQFNLTASGFEGTIDDPSRAANNYLTNADGDWQLNEDAVNLLPVLDETQLVPFYIGSKIVVFHSINGNLTEQPLIQTFDISSNPFRASKFFILGLAGSWGDWFTVGDWAVNLTFVYTDDTTNNYLLNHSYVDDWWYGANPGGICISAPTGAVTEIDLGTQTDTPRSHIHTHTTRFYLDYFKYLKAVIFADPGDDRSGGHLLSLTFR
jgi:flagellin-like protein